MIPRYFPRSRSRCQSSKRTNEHASSICSCRRVFAAVVPFPQRRVSFPRGFAIQEIILVRCYFRSFSFSRASIAVNSIFFRARNHFLVPAPRAAKENSVHWHAARPLSFWCIVDLEFHQILLIVFSRKKRRRKTKNRSCPREFYRRKNSISCSYVTRRFLLRDRNGSLFLISMWKSKFSRFLGPVPNTFHGFS